MISDDNKERQGAPRPTGDAAGADNDVAQDGHDGKEMRDAIGKKLKTLYDSIAREPVPERFSELLKQLRKNEERPK